MSRYLLLLFMLFLFAANHFAIAGGGSGLGPGGPPTPVTPLKTPEELLDEAHRKAPMTPEKRELLKKLSEQFKENLKELEKLLKGENQLEGLDGDEEDEPQKKPSDPEEQYRQLKLFLKEENGELTPDEKQELDEFNKAVEREEKEKQERKLQRRHENLLKLGFSEGDIELFDGELNRTRQRLELEERLKELGPRESEERKRIEEEIEKLKYTPAEEKRLKELREKLQMARENNEKPKEQSSLPGNSQSNDMLLTVSLNRAIGKGVLLLNMTGDGQDTKSPSLIVTNNSSLPCLAKIPAGTFFVPSDPKFQTMMLVEQATVAVAGKGQSSKAVHTVCADNKTLLPPAPAGLSSGAPSYSCAAHPSHEMGAFASASRQVINQMAASGSFAGKALLENDPTTALQMTIWSEAGSRTKTSKDDLTEATVSTDLHAILSRKVGRPLESKEKEQLKPSILEMLKTVNLCQKVSNACIASAGVTPASTATAQFMAIGSSSK